MLVQSTSDPPLISLATVKQSSANRQSNSSKYWNPRNYGSSGLSAAQLTKIRTDLAGMATSVFAQSLSAGGYEVVTEEVTP